MSKDTRLHTHTHTHTHTSTHANGAVANLEQLHAARVVLGEEAVHELQFVASLVAHRFNDLRQRASDQACVASASLRCCNAGIHPPNQPTNHNQRTNLVRLVRLDDAAAFRPAPNVHLEAARVLVNAVDFLTEPKVDATAISRLRPDVSVGQK